MNKKILVIPGDGIGPEVTTWGKAVLEKIAQDFGHEFTFDEALMGHAGIEATGNPLPDETLAKAKASDAILLDNSYMTPEEQMEWFCKIIESLKG